MAVSKEDIKTAYPLPVYNYRVSIAGAAGSQASVAFSEVSGLDVSYETSTYKESSLDGEPVGPRVRYMPAQAPATTLTLKKGLVKGVSVPTLYDWINTTKLNLVEKKDITISLLDEEGAAVITWTVVNAFPTKLDAPTFDADSNDVAIESMELMADNLLIADQTAA